MRKVVNQVGKLRPKRPHDAKLNKEKPLGTTTQQQKAYYLLINILFTPTILVYYTKFSKPLMFWKRKDKKFGKLRTLDKNSEKYKNTTFRHFFNSFVVCSFICSFQTLCSFV